ncbi:MAG: DUF4369 domain-containing protein [Phocaeicola sp.]
MRKHIHLLGLALLLLTGCNQRTTYYIYGEMSDHSCDNSLIFLVPAEGPQTSETVDSVYIREKKFHFKGRKEQMCILRLSHRHRLNHQEILVVTEPGEIKVYNGATGKVWGTPQNERLQQWKEQKDADESSLMTARKRWLETKSTTDSLHYFTLSDSLRNHLNHTTWRLIMDTGSCTLAHFFYERFKQLFSDKEKAQIESRFISQQ